MTYLTKGIEWHVRNVNEVPDAYVQRLVDPKKVDIALRNGVREIPGIVITKEKEVED